MKRGNATKPYNHRQIRGIKFWDVVDGFIESTAVCMGWSLIMHSGRWNLLCSTHYYPESSVSSPPNRADALQMRWREGKDTKERRMHSSSAQLHCCNEHKESTAVVFPPDRQKKKSVTGYLIIVTTKSIPSLDSVQAHNPPVCTYIVPAIVGNKQHLRNEVNAWAHMWSTSMWHSASGKWD